ncbi:MAG: TadG family pilus assembly protein [Panacagrimonas sp.]
MTRSARKQGGSILVNTAGGLLIGVILLSVVDLGYLFYYKREYQKAADLAALAGARQLPSGCASATSAVSDSTTLNLAGRGGTPTTQCGTWNPEAVPPASRFTVTATNPDAVRVIVTGQAPRFLSSVISRQVSASAIATVGDALAAFAVGTRAVRVTGDSILGASLKGLGLNVNNSGLISYDGLATLTITPGDLLSALGIPVSADITVGGLNALLAAEHVRLDDLMDATVTLAGHAALVSTNGSLVGNVTALAKAVDRPLGLYLGSNSGTHGLFAEIIAPNETADAALTTRIGAMDVLVTAIGVATQDAAIEGGVDLTIPALATITSKLSVIEPPSIAIGGLGPNGKCDPGEACPTAYTAQVRTYLHITTHGPLHNLGLVKMDLPIVLDLITGKGTLQELCTDRVKAFSGADQAEIEVDSTIFKACIGKMDDEDIFSKSTVCEDDLGGMELLNVANLLKLPNNSITINGLEGGGTVRLAEGQTQRTGNNLAVGTTVSNLVNELIHQVFGGTLSGTSLTSAQLDDLAKEIYDETLVVCNDNNAACRASRLAAARARIQATAEMSGLLTGVINGVFDLVYELAHPCGLGGDHNNCKANIRYALDQVSTVSGGIPADNGVPMLIGVLKPVLNSLGAAVLTPLLQNVLGLSVGETDVHLTSLGCGGNPQLVD